MSKATQHATFAINPRTMTSLTPAIGVIVKKKEDPATLRDTATLHEMIVHEAKPPNEKAALPMTASQEVGWYAAQHAEKDPFRVASKTCDEVAYATLYFETFGVGPYARKAATAAAGGAGAALKAKK